MTVDGAQDPRDDPARLLSAAIDAARGKQPGEAMALLRRVLAAEPENATAWLWMSGVIRDPVKREACLRKVLDLEPDNVVARRGLARAQQDAAHHLLLQGIQAAEAGDKQTAHKLLTDVVMREEQNLDAWLWLSRVVASAEDREVCYENILTLDPENAIAQDGLELLHQARAAAEEQPWDEVRQREEAFVAPTVAAGVLGEAYRDKHTVDLPEPEPEETPASDVLWATYREPSACPYCAKPTEPSDRLCDNCRGKLWIKHRPRERRSALLWVLIGLQAVSTISLAAVPFIALYVVGMMLGVPRASELLPAYIGLPTTIPQATLQAVGGVFPPVLFWSLWLPFLVGVVYVVGLYLRWRVMYYLMLVGAALGLMSSIASMAFTGGSLPGLIGGFVGLAMSVVSVVIVLQVEGDFQVERVRIHLTLDQGLKDDMGYLLRGRAYLASKMWALAAIHFRQAAALSVDSIDGLVGVARAAVKIGDTPLARWALETAEERDPANPRIGAALDALATQQETSEAET